MRILMYFNTLITNIVIEIIPANVIDKVESYGTLFFIIISLSYTPSNSVRPIPQSHSTQFLIIF